MAFHLAQFNQARAVAPIDSPAMAGFIAELQRINELADVAPGFVWRFQGDALDEPAAAGADDPRMLLNLSVWRSVEDLHAYVYRSDHAKLMARRREWFEPSKLPQVVLFWVAAGELPTLAQGIERLERLRAEGPSAHAFTFKQRFDPPRLAAS